MPTVFITGANRGLGLEFAKIYAENHWKVIACCRVPGEATDLNQLASKFNKEIIIYKMDICKQADINKFCNEYRNETIDLLINNAGAQFENYGSAAYENMGEDPNPANYDYDMWSETMNVNLFAPTKLTGHLTPMLQRSKNPKVVMMSSGIASLGNTWQAGRYAYKTSKAALNMVVRCVGEWLQSQNIAIFAVSPGWTRTDMGGPNAPHDSQTAVAGLYTVISEAKFTDTGSFYNFDGKKIPW